MKSLFKIMFGALVLAAGLLGAVPVHGADDQIVAVLSSNGTPYKQALEGLQQALGYAVPSYVLTEGQPKIPENARIIIAIGGKATVFPYPGRRLLIYCLAPGIKVKPEDHDGPLLKIHTSPSVHTVISQLKELQPALKRIAVLWAGDSIQDYIDQKKEIANSLGVEIVSDRIRDPQDLPDHLRALKGKVDAIWFPPDAAMVTPRNFITVKEFASSNGIPFYVPSDGMVEQGATASVYRSFYEIGQTAGEMAHLRLQGHSNVDNVFSNQEHVAINMTSAKACGLPLSSEVLKKAEKVFP